jgi:hypothetical protein
VKGEDEGKGKRRTCRGRYESRRIKMGERKKKEKGIVQR